MKARIKGFAVIALVGMLALVCAPQAQATMELTLQNGTCATCSIAVFDNGVGDANTAVGAITFIGAIGQYTINVSTGIAQNGINHFLDLNSINTTGATGAGMLTIGLSSTGFTVPAPQFSFGAGGTSSLGGAVSFSAYGGTSNGLFDTVGNQIGTLSFTTTALNPAFSGNTVSSIGTTTTPYSLTIVANLNGITAGSASFDAAINAVPEPVSVSLLGGVLVLTATAIRRKLRRAA